MVLVGAVVLAALGLLVRSCHFDRRCLTGTYPAHCEGAVALQCEGGKGSLPVVRYSDCRKALAGPGICVEIQKSIAGFNQARCMTPCDSATFIPHCDGNWALNCVRGDLNEPPEVAMRSCQPQFGCAVRPDDSGQRAARCGSDVGHKVSPADELERPRRSPGGGPPRGLPP
jgi:hypothetical protein